MSRKTPPRAQDRPRRPEGRQEQVPTWRNTRPRQNAEIDRRDMERGVERLEMVLGR